MVDKLFIEGIESEDKVYNSLRDKKDDPEIIRKQGAKTGGGACKSANFWKIGPGQKRKRDRQKNSTATIVGRCVFLHGAEIVTSKCAASTRAKKRTGFRSKGLSDRLEFDIKNGSRCTILMIDKGCRISITHS
jgi:hypothetical protein